jgi:O-methyltransferase involved in polyketide biosynthesis
MAAGEGPTAPEELRLWDVLSRPNIARIYDYLLGGKDNFEVDREVAVHLAEVQPLVVTGVRANRAFARRATAFLAEHGIAQFIDLGSGLPTGVSVHEIAQRANPDARVVYVDNDPIVLVHGQALLADNHRTIVVEGDIREPEQILADRQVRGLIDVEQPIAVLCAAILHFVSDAEDPARIVGAFREVMVPGSALVISHVVDDGDGQRDAATREGAAIYCETTAPFVLRSRAQVSAWFEGFTLVPPGLVEADAWRRKGNGKAKAPIVAGVGFLDPPDGRDE